MVTELITKSFEQQCLAFPSRVDKALAEIETVEQAKDLLDKASAMQHYADRLKGGVEIARPVALGVLKIKAKLGDLLPAKPPKETGRGKKTTSPTEVVFPSATIAAYRKIAKNQERLQDYYEAIDDVPSQADFLKKITADKRSLAEKKRERRRKQNAKKAAAVEDVAKSGAVFATILLDPPWDWGDEGDVNQMGRAKPDYSTMSIDELAALPVGNMADVDCHLYMWITNRSLPKGFGLLDAWGFRYVTMLTWPKKSFGMGNYFRGQTEHILFGVKGSQMLSRKDIGTLLPTWDRGPDGHSSKPKELYDLIESCSPGPFLEMFARSNRDGWHTWGADANG